MDELDDLELLSKDELIEKTGTMPDLEQTRCLMDAYATRLV